MSALGRLWSLRGRRPRFVLLSLAVLAGLLAYPLVDWWLRAAGIASEFAFHDFRVYRVAVDHWQAGEPLYVQNDDGGYHRSYLYPPIVLVAFRPFAELGFDQSAIAWAVVTVFLLWVGMQLVVAELGLALRWWERGLLLWALVGFHPLLLSIKMGQTAALLGALVCFAFAALSAGRDGGSGSDGTGRPTDPGGRGRANAASMRSAAWAAVSGACTAAVVVFKLAYAPVAAHLLADRDRMLGAVATGVVLAAASLALFDLATHWTYLDVLRWGITRGSGSRSPALWLPPYYRPLYWLPHPLAIRIGASLAVAAAAVAAVPGSDRRVFALGVVAFPLVTPRAYTYYFVALVPAVAVLLAIEFEADGYPTVPVVGLALLAVHAYGLAFFVKGLPAVLPGFRALRPVYPLLQPGLWGNALLVALAGLRVGERVALPAGVRDRLLAAVAGLRRRLS